MVFVNATRLLFHPLEILTRENEAFHLESVAPRGEACLRHARFDVLHERPPVDPLYQPNFMRKCVGGGLWS